MDVILLNKSNVKHISPRTDCSASVLLPSPRQLTKRTDNIIREGNDYQVDVDDLDSSTKSDNEDYPDRDICIWRFPKYNKISDDLIMNYCQKSKEYFGINIEQSLFILLSLNYDLTAAKEKLKMQIFLPEKFSDEDQSAFRFAYSCYGKNFLKIRQMISHKSLSALVQHYYDTKKYQLFKSTVDRENLVIINDDIDENISETKSNTEKNGLCENCRNVVKKLYFLNELELCTACKITANQHRPCKIIERPKRPVFCPIDMRKTAKDFSYFLESAQDIGYENADDFGDLQIACKKVTNCEKAIQNVKDEILKIRAVAIRTENQSQDQFKGISFNSNFFQARFFLERTMPVKSRLSYSWTDAEKLLAFQALVMNGCDFSSVAEVIGTKTADMVKSFYYDECKIQIDKVLENGQYKEIKQEDIVDYEEEFKKLIKTPEVIDLD